MNPDILDVRYFGSAARGDLDVSSDIDVLCISRSGSMISRAELEGYVDSHFIKNHHLDVSFYGVKRIQDMWSEGHLFAWHIYLESKSLGEDFTFINSLGTPCAYLNSRKDIAQLKILLEEVYSSIQAVNLSSVYDAGILYVAARNIGISASWWSERGIDFSRMAPFNLQFDGQLYSPDISKELYSLLCAARHCSMRGADRPAISELDLLAVCDKLIIWSDQVIDKIEVLS